MEQLPVPDNMESIWVDINSGLDAGPSPGPKQGRLPKKGPGPVWGLLIITGIIISAVFLFRHPHKTGTKQNLPVAPQEKVIIPDSSNTKEPVKEYKNPT